MFNLMSIILNVPITLIALTGHELAHAWVSDKLGDPTPRNTGRLTINPLAHLDLVGTILMILTGFGWAKPVMINPMYYRNTKKDTALVAAAGPLANLIMAFVGLLIYAIVFVVVQKTGFGTSIVQAVGNLAYLFAFRNLCFMVFNIIPIPPLDGSKVLGMFLPDRAYNNMLRYERYSMILIMLLSLTGAFSTIIGTGVTSVFNLIMSFLQRLVDFVL